MEYANLTSILPKFVQQLSQDCGRHDNPLTVNDLRLGIRSERLSEIRDWSNYQLDAIEVHAAQFDDNAPVEHVFSLTSEADQAANDVSVSSICSPSPFAWT